MDKHAENTSNSNLKRSPILEIADNLSTCVTSCSPRDLLTRLMDSANDDFGGELGRLSCSRTKRVRKYYAESLC